MTWCKNIVTNHPTKLGGVGEGGGTVRVYNFLMRANHFRPNTFAGSRAGGEELKEIKIKKFNHEKLNLFIQ